MKSVADRWQIVTWLPMLRAITAAILWSVLATVAQLPTVDLPLRRIGR